MVKQILIAVMVFGASALYGYERAEILAKLSACVEELEQVQERYATWLPPRVARLDPTFRRWAARAEHLRKGSKLLEKKFANHTIGKVEAHLLANSLVSCEQEKQQLASYLESMLLFAVALLACLGCAVGIGFWWKLRTPPTQKEFTLPSDQAERKRHH